MSDIFLNQFELYDNYAPPGVLLPKIEIESKYYSELNLPNDCSNYDFLRKLCLEGVKKKGIDSFPNKQDYYDRVKMELKILKELGFIDYVLLNWDILNYCHDNNIPTGPGRGSAAGSLVLFLIDVTKVDSIKYDLFFERFVSKSRARKIEKDGVTYLDGSLLADVDNDIAYEHRQAVISYIEAKHPGRTSNILTLNTLSGKLCIKECGKIVGEYSEKEVNDVSSLIPKKYGKVVPLEDATKESEGFAEWATKNEGVFKIARKIEGLNKNTGVHPSGIAISHDDISEICPIQKTSEGNFVTGYDMNWVAELMVKFDILGLRTLSVIYDVCSNLDIDVYDIDLSDPELFKPLQDLKNPQGLFQIEAETNFRVCQKIKPKNLEQLSAVIAIARPGALEFTDKYSEYVATSTFQSVHEFFDDVLDYTGGIPLYQEQLMKMAVKVGFTLDESEQLRRIVGKKKVDQMPAWQKKIRDKVRANNLPIEVSDVLWRVAEDSANYSFNKSHSISYSMLAAWTTYLKFKHPKEFFLSLLRMSQFEPNPQDEISKISRELSYFNINLLQPNLIKSSFDFTVDKNNIRFGLNSIKGVSEKSLKALTEFRDTENSNKYDVFLSAKQAGLNIGVLSSLVQAGSLSEDADLSRPRLVLEAQAFNLLTDREKRNFIALGEKYKYDILESIHAAKKDSLVADDGKPLMKDSRFQTFKKKYDKYKKIYEQNIQYEKFANWFFEKKLLGYSYSCRLKDVFDSQHNELKDSLYYESMDSGQKSKFIGVVEESFRKTSANGNQYIKVLLSDELGSFPAIMVDSRRSLTCTEYIESGNLVPDKDNIVVITGRKAEDVLFIDGMSIVDERICMKLSDLK
jgi:DNA polymerase-3 subunit alpha|tara:strand:+ start:1091 stop:3658 length:2568 start_codon:yes stop_codon:yes gene_type:complete